MLDNISTKCWLFSHVLVFSLCYSCTSKSSISDEISFILEMSGQNRTELVKALENFHQDKMDSLKLRATTFLIMNMPFNTSFNNSGITKSSHTDLHYVKGDYLINNINEAFSSWRESPWSSTANFSIFCEYVLPYQNISHEGSVSLDRKSLRITQPEQIDRLTYLKSTILSLDNGHLNEKVFFLRANGIPTAVDMCLQLANKSETLEWFSVLDHNATSIFIDPKVDKKLSLFKNSKLDIKYNLDKWNHFEERPYRIAKVYRKQFGKNDNCLIVKNNGHELIPENLADIRLLDVTDQYLESANLSLDIHNPHQRRFAYLATFDINGWYPIAWTEIDQNNRAIFARIGKDILYQPVTISNEGEFIPAQFPLILHANGKVEEIIYNDSNRREIKLFNTSQWEEPIEQYLESVYELLYWDNTEWKSLGKRTIKNEAFINFENAPSTALFWLRNLTNQVDERCFTYENGRQIFW